MRQFWVDTPLLEWWSRQVLLFEWIIEKNMQLENNPDMNIYVLICNQRWPVYGPELHVQLSKQTYMRKK